MGGCFGPSPDVRCVPGTATRAAGTDVSAEFYYPPTTPYGSGVYATPPATPLYPSIPYGLERGLPFTVMSNEPSVPGYGFEESRWRIDMTAGSCNVSIERKAPGTDPSARRIFMITLC
jgi:hypothetical protein